MGDALAAPRLGAEGPIDCQYGAVLIRNMGAKVVISYCIAKANVHSGGLSHSDTSSLYHTCDPFAISFSCIAVPHQHPKSITPDLYGGAGRKVGSRLSPASAAAPA